MRLLILAAILCSQTTPLFANCDPATEGYTLDWDDATNPNGSLSMSEIAYRDGSTAGDPHNDPIGVDVDFTGYTQNLASNGGSFPRFFNNLTGGQPAPYTSLVVGVDHYQSGLYVDYVITFDKPVSHFRTTVLDVDARPAQWSRRVGYYRGFQDVIIINADNAGSSVPVALNVPDPTPTVFIGPPLASNQASANNSPSSNGDPYGNLDVYIADPVTRVVVRFLAGQNFGFQTTDPQYQLVGLTDLEFCAPREPEISATKTVNIFNEDGLGCAIIPGVRDPDALAMIPGACVEYHIEIQNTGSGAGEAMNIVDSLESNLIYMGASHSGFANSTAPNFEFNTPNPGTDCGLFTCEIEIDNGLIESDTTGEVIIRTLLK